MDDFEIPIWNGSTGTTGGILSAPLVNIFLITGLNVPTFHPAQRVLLAAAETDTVGCVERSMSFNEVVPLKASHTLQSVNILIDQKHKYQYIHRDSLGAPSLFHTCE